jgi:hypothetical protein
LDIGNIEYFIANHRQMRKALIKDEEEEGMTEKAPGSRCQGA